MTGKKFNHISAVGFLPMAEKTNDMIQQKITEIAEILGWSVDFSEPQNGKTDVNFAKYTAYGQDFNFSVELEDDDMEAFIDNIHEYYENFDVDEEAYIWIGSDGHGKNGAPYHIADIVKDMEEAEVMMADLYEVFRQFYSQLELQDV
jgi:hypothetical protein